MKNLKLNTLANQSLSNKEMTATKGGINSPTVVCGPCSCGCIYEGKPGGSTSGANADANCELGLHSPLPK